MKKTSVRYSTDNIFQRNGDNSNRFLNPYSTKVEESTVKKILLSNLIKIKYLTFLKKKKR